MVAAVEEATSVMKNVLDTPEPVVLFEKTYSDNIVEKSRGYDCSSTRLSQRSV